MSKQAERDYALKVEQHILYNKPFNDPRTFREFAIPLEVFLQSVPRGGRILDLGCGPGWTSLFLARAGFQVVGVDISERMIEVARERAERENLPVEFLVADMEELTLDQAPFDGVLLFDCLHHCPGYQQVLRRAWEQLRPGGHLLLLETTWLHRISPHARETTRIYGVTELGFTKGQLRRALKGTGFEAPTFLHDPGPIYRGFLGFLRTGLRLWCDFFAAFPQAKNIALARKPVR